MKNRLPMIFAVLLSCTLLAGPVLAEEENMSDEQYCEEEARNAGLESAEEIAAYVQDCMTENDTAEHSLDEEATAADNE